ncbi:MAG TPA: hypothetical protein VG943_00390 [Caulobacterales bacterium]|nr:hypothetical protein [Caulobacterales bacterium]
MLKKLSSVTAPDDRFEAVVVHDAQTGAVRPMSIADHHAAIAAIELAVEVSEPVRTVFERARNAFLYSWFVYDLTPLAEGQGYAALEMALRETRRREFGVRTARGLSEQLHEAFRAGLFEDFPLPPGDEYPDRSAYFVQITSLIRHFRNHLAHGSAYVNMPGATLEALRLCRDLIDHLYRKQRGFGVTRATD